MCFDSEDVPSANDYSCRDCVMIDEERVFVHELPIICRGGFIPSRKTLFR